MKEIGVERGFQPIDEIAVEMLRPVRAGILPKSLEIKHKAGYLGDRVVERTVVRGAGLDVAGERAFFSPRHGVQGPFHIVRHAPHVLRKTMEEVHFVSEIAERRLRIIRNVLGQGPGDVEHIARRGIQMFGFRKPGREIPCDIEQLRVVRDGSGVCVFVEPPQLFPYERVQSSCRADHLRRRRRVAVLEGRQVSLRPGMHVGE
ncbi:hypothetical protein [Nocardia abscessus]|uniref:hypothetical protein n=1 Tax=Nocardia abscessus TaxID=120957 RepID=UPI0024563C58|nr:hypothetical protein [Nocardia abscessus]